MAPKRKADTPPAVESLEKRRCDTFGSGVQDLSLRYVLSYILVNRTNNNSSVIKTEPETESKPFALAAGDEQMYDFQMGM